VVARPEGSPASGGAAPGQHDRGGAKPGEGTGGAEQCAAHGASRCPREGARWVGWLGGRAESRARRWLPGGGRRDIGSGEPAARAGQQASVGATGGPSGVRSSTCLRRKAVGGGVHREHLWRRQWRLGVGARRAAVRLAPLKARVPCGGGHGSRHPAGCGMGQGRCEKRCARTAATPLVGRRGGHEHVAQWERVWTAIRRGQSHCARTGGW
jgi:hypothetical protein